MSRTLEEYTVEELQEEINLRNTNDSKMEKFYESWNFLNEHRYFHSDPLDRFSCFQTNLDIMVVKVNPENLTIEDEKLKNTKTQIWLETGEWTDDDKNPFESLRTHDPILDCGGDTFEDAIIELAQLVQIHYGDGKYTEKEEKEYKEYWASRLEEPGFFEIKIVQLG